jgi:hypothetical protein
MKEYVIQESFREIREQNEQLTDEIFELHDEGYEDVDIHEVRLADLAENAEQELAEGDP